MACHKRLRIKYQFKGGLKMDKCAFDLGKRKCSALTTKNCVGCKFCKSIEELREGREKAAERLMTLDKETFEYINAKYSPRTGRAYI